MIKFEEVPTNLANTIWRASIPGGWLVQCVSDVVHNTAYAGMQSGHDWRSSVTFVPDPTHEWRLK